jgi:hypothetical protein
MTEPIIPGQEVRFRIGAAYLPAPEMICMNLFADHELVGVVTDVSRDPLGQPAYVVVRVPGQQHSVIVSVQSVWAV